MQFTRKFEFDAAHALTESFGEKETQLHGHRYRIDITIESLVKNGMAANLNELKKVVQTEVIDVLDHSNLNNHLNIPSAENIALWTWGKLKDKLQGLVEIKVYETPNHWVTYRGGENTDDKG
ncbi:6-carboxytetrahydropterin synthase [Candidatus Pacearchaeota archaeon]|nr:6-carboxytetrahydropterin synthase [Candidatus Pacearchaeota archaeon]